MEPAHFAQDHMSCQFRPLPVHRSAPCPIRHPNNDA